MIFNRDNIKYNFQSFPFQKVKHLETNIKINDSILFLLYYREYDHNLTNIDCLKFIDRAKKEFNIVFDRIIEFEINDKIKNIYKIKFFDKENRLKKTHIRDISEPDIAYKIIKIIKNENSLLYNKVWTK